MLHFRSPTWVCCIYHEVYCRDNHIQYIRSPTWVYCISCHVNQEPHSHMPTGILHMPSSNIRSNTGVYYISHQVYCGGCLCCISGAPLGCTAFAIKCTAYPIIMAAATTEAEEAIASFVFVQIMVIPLKKLLARVILVLFGHV